MWSEENQTFIALTYCYDDLNSQSQIDMWLKSNVIYCYPNFGINTVCTFIMG